MKSVKQLGVLTSSEAELAAELKANGLNGKNLSEKQIAEKILVRRELQKSGKIKPVEAKSFITDTSGGIVIEKSHASEEENIMVKDRQREHRSAYRDSYFVGQ